MTKPTKWVCAQRIHSLDIRPVWSESSLSAWRKLRSLAIHWVHSEDADQTGRMPRLIWVFAGCTLILLVLSCRSSFNKTDAHSDAEFSVSRNVWSTIFMRQTVHRQNGKRWTNERYGTFFFKETVGWTLAFLTMKTLQMSRLMTKPTKWLCAQRRLRSAWASAQSDQSLHCALNR